MNNKIRLLSHRSFGLLHVTHAMTPSKWLRIIFAARLTGSILELIARRSHPRPWYYIHHHSGFVRLEVETSDPQALQSDELVD